MIDGTIIGAPRTPTGARRTDQQSERNEHFSPARGRRRGGLPFKAPTADHRRAAAPFRDPPEDHLPAKVCLEGGLRKIPDETVRRQIHGGDMAHRTEHTLTQATFGYGEAG
jgi:hypothetical protein